MKLKPCLNDNEILNLAKLQETGGGSALIKLLDYEITKTRKEYEDSPCISDTECKKDFRFKLGVIFGMKVAGQSADIARQMILKNEGEQP